MERRIYRRSLTIRRRPIPLSISPSKLKRGKSVWNLLDYANVIEFLGGCFIKKIYNNDDHWKFHQN